jgi:hypothetical protein
MSCMKWTALACTNRFSHVANTLFFEIAFHWKSPPIAVTISRDEENGRRKYQRPCKNNISIEECGDTTWSEGCGSKKMPRGARVRSNAGDEESRSILFAGYVACWLLLLDGYIFHSRCRAGQYEQTFTLHLGCAFYEPQRVLMRSHRAAPIFAICAHSGMVNPSIVLRSGCTKAHGGSVSHWPDCGRGGSHAWSLAMHSGNYFLDV